MLEGEHPHGCRVGRFPRARGVLFNVIAQTTDLAGEDLNDFLDLIILIAGKTGSVWHHKEGYLAEQKRLIEKFSSDTSATREHSEKLYDEFDVFAVQIKSTLDHLTKVMRPIQARNKWTLGTFGDKGERVLASLQRNAESITPDAFGRWSSSCSTITTRSGSKRSSKRETGGTITSRVA